MMTSCVTIAQLARGLQGYQVLPKRSLKDEVPHFGYFREDEVGWIRFLWCFYASLPSGESLDNRHPSKLQTVAVLQFFMTNNG